MGDEDKRTVWVGNFDPENTTEDILYELFLQAGPLHYVKIPKDKTSKKNKNFGFICYRHTVSVPYAIQLLNGIDVHGRNLRVQSRNHCREELEEPGGIHSLDPDFGNPQHFSGPSQAQTQPYMQPYMQPHMQGSSLLGMPNQNVVAMAHQQMALLNAFQPIPLAANPLLNAPKERYSDRHGSLNYGRNNQYMRDDSPRNSPYHRGNGSRNNYYHNDNRKHNYNQDAASSPYSHRDSKDKSGMAGDKQQSQGGFDYGRLGQSNRDSYHHQYHSPHGRKYGDQYGRYRTDSHHGNHNNHRSSGRYHSSHNDKRNHQ